MVISLILCISVLFVVISPLSVPDFIYLGPLSFFSLMSLARGVSPYLFEEPDPTLIELIYFLSLIPYCFLVYSSLFLSFYLRWVLFVFLFLLPLGVRLAGLFEIFLVS